MTTRLRPYIYAVVPLTSLIVPDECMREVLHSGRQSETPDAPVLLRPRGDMPGYEICDGLHRVASAIRQGLDCINGEIDTGPDEEPYEPPFYDFTVHVRLD